MKRKNKIKVLHVVPSLAHGGTERLLYDALTRLDEGRFEMSICCTHDSGDSWQHRQFHSCGIQTSVLSLSTHRYQRVYKLLFYLRRNRFDIVHIHNYEDNLIEARISAILANIPVIITHDHNVHNIWWLSKKRLLAWKVLNAFTYRNITISETVKKQRLKCCGDHQEKVVCIKNGIDLEYFHMGLREGSAGAKATLGIDSANRVVGGIGRLIEYKRFNLLIETASLLKNRDNVIFLIVGDGPLKDELRKQKTRLGVDNKVKLLGWCSDVRDIYRALDVLVVTADWPEGFGLVTTEAMASGIPVVAVRNPTALEIITEDCGILVEPEPERIAEAVLRLLDDHHLSSALAKRGRRLVEDRFDVNRTARELENLYLESVSNHSC